jgi:hypothetical protein
MPIRPQNRENLNIGLTDYFLRLNSIYLKTLIREKNVLRTAKNESVLSPTIL